MNLNQILFYMLTLIIVIILLVVILSIVVAICLAFKRKAGAGEVKEGESKDYNLDKLHK